MNHEFLRLLQAVEAGRKCEGKGCHEIRDVDIMRAEITESLQEAHLLESMESSHEEQICPTCKEIERGEIALRESFHAQGIDLPLEVLVDV